MEATTNDSSAACGQSALTDGFERMFRVTEFDHPEHATYKWTKLEVEWINERIRTAMAAEREACATVCEAEGDGHRDGFGKHCAAIIRMRSNVELSGGAQESAKSAAGSPSARTQGSAFPPYKDRISQEES